MACALSPDTAWRRCTPCPPRRGWSTRRSWRASQRSLTRSRATSRRRSREPGAFGSRRKKVSSGRGCPRPASADEAARWREGRCSGRRPRGDRQPPPLNPRRRNQTREGGAHGFGFGSTVGSAGDEWVCCPRWPSGEGELQKGGADAGDAAAARHRLRRPRDVRHHPEVVRGEASGEQPHGIGKSTDDSTTGPARNEARGGIRRRFFAPRARAMGRRRGMDACTMSAKNAAAAAAWADYHERNAWPSPSWANRRAGVRAGRARLPASAEPTSRHLQGSGPGGRGE